MDSLVKPLTWVLGVVLLLVGLAGLLNLPLPVFEVNTTHNIVHLLSGIVALLAAANGYQYSKIYLIVFGIVYGLVTILGFLMVGFVWDLLALNTPDNYLHLVITAACLIVGLGSKNMA